MFFDTLPQNERQKAEALTYILEAWDEAVIDGLEPESVAHAALFAALSDLVSTYGEDAVSKMTEGLVSRIQNGEFSLERTIQ